ncbi:MAG: hypothetical protein RL662_762 [Bacteroidota bacterium]|jgi:hypothetical protein
MNTLNTTGAAMLIATSIWSIYLGWLLTETSFRLADKFHFFNKRPFNCRPCLTFHLTWIHAGAISLTESNIKLFLYGVLMAAVIWIGLEIENRNKMIK